MVAPSMSSLACRNGCCPSLPKLPATVVVDARGACTIAQYIIDGDPECSSLVFFPFVNYHLRSHLLSPLIMATRTTLPQSEKEKIETQVDQLGSLPYPSAAFGTVLALRGMMVPDNVVEVVQGVAGQPIKDKVAVIKPTRALCFTFGAANLIGTYIMFLDPKNGAGFNFAWNALYLIVNGKQAMELATHGKFVPAGLGAFALFNAGVYGKRYFSLF